MEPVENPANALIARYGGIRETALALGLTYERVRRWAKYGIPLECALEAEAQSKGLIAAEDVVKYHRSRAQAPANQAS